MPVQTIGRSLPVVLSIRSLQLRPVVVGGQGIADLGHLAFRLVGAEQAGEDDQGGASRPLATR